MIDRKFTTLFVSKKTINHRAANEISNEMHEFTVKKIWDCEYYSAKMLGSDNV